MAILVVGSVAFDSIETPHGKVDHCLGGAATHFALAASYFTKVRVIAVVGQDFTPENEAGCQEIAMSTSLNAPSRTMKPLAAPPSSAGQP